MGFVVEKIRKMFWRLHMRKFRRTRHVFSEYGYREQKINFGKDGVVMFARWQHPGHRPSKFPRGLVSKLKMFIREGDTVMDIGAHAGDTTLPLALAAGVKGHALALEPNPYVHKILQATTRLNKDKLNIIPLCFAATDKDGEYTFHYSDASFSNGGDLDGLDRDNPDHQYPLKVMGKNLSAYLHDVYPHLLERLSYIKIDTEGHDRDVIVSIQDILLKSRPTLRVEVMNRLSADECRALYDALASLKYRMFEYIEEGATLCGQPLTRDNIKREATYDLLAIAEEKVR